MYPWKKDYVEISVIRRSRAWRFKIAAQLTRYRSFYVILICIEGIKFQIPINQYNQYVDILLYFILRLLMQTRD